ncbi:predicted protein [Chaetoceros tenuissimus]|uniref:Uncharacterized protein n=1 Tax=Chaetoceros tenuissimus TaxID=426638 RepID=A0AAD3GYL4_9STRA|nr:predicted protein [Chaetoceros tenuissimus]
MTLATYYSRGSRFLVVDDEVQSNLSVQHENHVVTLLDTTSTSSTPPEKERSIETFVAEVYTTVAAISISCNFLLLYLISKKKYPDEESKQPVYNRIMCALAIISSFSAGNYFVAGISGSLADNMMFGTDDSSKSFFDMVEFLKQTTDISLGCYVQSIVDFSCYFAFMLGCCWLCLYFLLRLNYGVARISPFVETAVYIAIFLVTGWYTRFTLLNVTVTQDPVVGMCFILPFSDDISVTIFSMLFTGIFVFGILAMLLIVYKTFREEQQINERSLSSFRQLSTQQQQVYPAISLSNFEATKDIAMQAIPFVVFLIFAFYIQVFFAFQSGFIYQIMDVICCESQGIYVLGLYLWFEMRTIKKHYPNVSNKEALVAIFHQEKNMEPVVEGEESREETPLLVEKKRCLIDITMVEDDMCADVMNAFREVDADQDKEEARRQAKRKEEEKRLKLQAENMRMFGGGFDSSLHQALEASFGDLDLEIANRKLNHYNASKDASKPVTHRYGSIDPTTFRTETTEEEVDNLSAEGTHDQSQLKIVGEGMILEEIQEGDEEEEEDAKGSSTDDKNQEQESSHALASGSAQQPQGAGRSVVSDLTMISTLRF